MKSIFDILKFEMANLGLMTEFLEACDWDEEECKKQIDSVMEYLNCTPLPIRGMPFEEWLHRNVKPSLIDLGLSIQQSEIILKIIINNKDLIIMQQNLPEC